VFQVNKLNLENPQKKVKQEIEQFNFNQNLAQTLRIKKGSKTKCLETLAGVAPPITRSCNWNSLCKFVTIKKLMS